MLRSLNVCFGAILFSTLAVSACRETTEYPLDPVVPGTGVDPETGKGTGGAGRGGASGSRPGGASGGVGTGGAPGQAIPPRDGAAPTGDAAVPPAPVPTADGAAPETPPATTGRAYALKEVAVWRGNAAGVYTLLFEAACEGAFIGSLTKAGPELAKRGLTASFAVIANACTTGNHWPKVKALADGGHEILNQGFSHACLGNNAAACGPMVPRSTDFAKEIGQAGTELKNRVGLTEPGVFIFPYDACSPASTNYLKTNGFLGARCGLGAMNASDFADAFSFKFDLWGPGVSSYRSGAPCRMVAADSAPNAAPAACRTHVLNAPLDEAIKQKGWFVRGLHGFQGDPGGYQPIAPADYASHLDVVAAKVKEGTLWVAGPNQVVKYRFARQLCGPPTLAGATLTFPAPSADCTKYATRLSYVVNTADGSDPATIAVTQGGARLVGKKIGAGTFVVEADPSKGPATLGD